MGFFKALGSLFTGGFGKTVEKGIDLASQKIRDTDKADDIIGKVVLKSLDSQPTIPIFDAIHKLGRQLMMMVLAYWYYTSWKAGNPIPIEDFMIIAGGPALYTVLKGTGRVAS
jgi:hypothetical protein